MKKLLSLLLALSLVTALAVPTLAAEPQAPAATEVGVILNGKAVAFPDAKPEKVSGRTMVPVRTLMEMLGGEVSIKDGLVTCKVGEKTLELRVGGDTVTISTPDPDGTVTVEAQGQTTTIENKVETVKLDVASYVKDGRTYVPVRFFAQALGYDVMWDRATNSAVLVDKAALIAGIDENFTVLNAALEKSQTDPTQNYKTTATYNITMDMAATEYSEAMSILLKMKLDMISSADAIEMKGSVDASSMAKVMDLENAVKEGLMTADMAAAITKALQNLTFEMRFDMKTMTYYMNIPALAMFTDGEIAAETWFKMDLSFLMAVGMPNFTELMNAQATVGNMIYLFFRSMVESTKSGAAQLYDATTEVGNVLTAFLGDSSAKKNGDAYTFHFGKAELDKIAGEKIADELFEKFSIDLTVKGGDMTIVFDVKTAKMEGVEDVFVLSGKMTANATKGHLDMLLSMGDQMKAKYILDIVMTPTTQKPQTLPPTGAKVMDLIEMMNDMMEQVVAPPTAAVTAATAPDLAA